MASLRSGSILSRPFLATRRPCRPLSVVGQDIRTLASVSQNPPGHDRPNVGGRRFAQFDLAGGTYVVTGGAQGLGLCMAEALVEAGGKVHCLDVKAEPSESFREAENRVVPEWGGSLHYHQADVTNTESIDRLISKIAADRKRLDGLIAAAGIQQCTPAIEYSALDIERMLRVNYSGVFLTASACARQMMRYKNQGSMCFIASMSGLIANRGFISPVYNSSKAAVIQLTRNLAMEWGRLRPDGSGGIRVNSLSPGHILTPMVLENFRKGEANRAAWEENSMLGRLSKPEEYKAAGLFLISNASSYMTGTNMVLDGGTTAWAGIGESVMGLEQGIGHGSEGHGLDANMKQGDGAEF